MHEASSPFEVADAMRAAGARRIAIDGSDGSGKSTLAKALAVELKIPVLHVDHFIVKHRGRYIANLDVTRLASALSAAEACIVEGVCMLQVLEHVSFTPDAVVYVKRMSHGYWCDERELDPQIPIEEHLHQLRADIQPLAKAFGESGDLGLTEEVIRYHASYRPHQRASLAYLREDA